EEGDEQATYHEARHPLVRPSRIRDAESPHDADLPPTPSVLTMTTLPARSGYPLANARRQAWTHSAPPTSTGIRRRRMRTSFSRPGYSIRALRRATRKERATASLSRLEESPGDESANTHME